MADHPAHGFVAANNRLFQWDIHADDVANTVTITAVYTDFNGGAVPDPQRAWIATKLNSGIDIVVDTITGKFGRPSAPDLQDPATVLLNPQDFSQASPGEILNAGPKTRTAQNLAVSLNRAGSLSFSSTLIL